jgi:hypothetical protein
MARSDVRFATSELSDLYSITRPRERPSVGAAKHHDSGPIVLEKDDQLALATWIAKTVMAADYLDRSLALSLTCALPTHQIDGQRT